MVGQVLPKILNKFLNNMSNPNQLYEDMEKLNALYEELCWGHDDELVFTHENGRVIVYNKTLEKDNERKSRTH